MCASLPRRTAKPERILCFDWYGGPVAGLAEADSAFYEFRLVATDEGQDVRLFAFTRVSELIFRKFADWWATQEPPGWPLWPVGMRSANADWDAFSALRADNLSSLGPPTPLVLTPENGLRVGVIEMIEWPAALQQSIPAEPDWGGLAHWLPYLQIQ